MYDNNYGDYRDDYAYDPDEFDDGESRRPRYTIAYKGYIFAGDTDGWNFHDVDTWEEASRWIDGYGDDIEVTDNWYDVTFAKGEWY